MKTLNRIAFVFLVIISMQSVAGGRAGQGSIHQMYQRSGDGLLSVQKVGGSWANPDQCDRSDSIVLTRDNSSRSEFYAALLAAQRSKSDIDAWLAGCVDWNVSTGRPVQMTKGYVDWQADKMIATGRLDLIETANKLKSSTVVRVVAGVDKVTGKVVFVPLQ